MWIFINLGESIIYKGTGITLLKKKNQKTPAVAMLYPALQSIHPTLIQREDCMICVNETDTIHRVNKIWISATVLANILI